MLVKSPINRNVLYNVMENDRIAVDKNWQSMSNRGQLKSTVVRELSLIENNHKSRCS